MKRFREGPGIRIVMVSPPDDRLAEVAKTIPPEYEWPVGRYGSAVDDVVVAVAMAGRRPVGLAALRTGAEDAAVFEVRRLGVWAPADQRERVALDLLVAVAAHAAERACTRLEIEPASDWGSELIAKARAAGLTAVELSPALPSGTATPRSQPPQRERRRRGDGRATRRVRDAQGLRASDARRRHRGQRSGTDSEPWSARPTDAEQGRHGEASYEVSLAMPDEMADIVGAIPAGFEWPVGVPGTAGRDAAIAVARHDGQPIGLAALRVVEGRSPRFEVRRLGAWGPTPEGTADVAVDLLGALVDVARSRGAEELLISPTTDWGRSFVEAHHSSLPMPVRIVPSGSAPGRRGLRWPRRGA